MKKYVGIALLAVFVSCSNSEHKTADHKDSTADVKDSVAMAAVEIDDPQVATIYGAYIALKDNLVKSDHKSSRESAKSLLTALNDKEGCESTALLAEKIVAAKDLAAQRKEFTYLSSDVIAMFKHADLKGGKIYVQHCPMANNGDGGDWLASERNIRNPYYGDEMMECGAVVEEIK